MKKIINIVAGGPKECLPILKRNLKEEIWVAVDGGLEYMLESKIDPDLIIGDFDSTTAITKKMLETCSYKQFPREKNKTDLELALSDALKENPQEIYIYGATGGRLDHEIINLQLLSKFLHHSVNVFIIDNKNRITLKNPGTYQIFPSQYNYVSFLSMNEQVDGLTLKGFRYPLENAYLRYGSSLCVSNELISKIGNYSFTSGIIIMVESKD